jgi:hypothetical protein
VDVLLNNPEFIRRARADLRPSRMAVAASVTVILCLLLLLIFYHPGDSPARNSQARSTAFTLYIIFVSAQALILGLRCLTSCSQAIASERLLKTFDFLRTTRLTSWELMLGIVFGAPLMAYFSAACILPFAFYFGLASGVSLLAMLLTYAMILLVAIVLSLAALTMSMKNDKPRAGEILLLLLVFGWPLIAVLIGAGSDSRFPGLTALTVVLGLLPFYRSNLSAPVANSGIQTVPFFGIQVPSLAVSIILYVSIGAWLVLMLVRNLKKDPEDIRLLSRWQAIGFTAYVNILVFALLDLRPNSPNGPGAAPISAAEVTAGYLALNCVILYAVGLATLTPVARLKTWWRNSARDIRFYWSDDGPPWPWIAASAGVALLLFFFEAAFSTRYIPFESWSVPALAGRLFILLVFAVRDILFLQWCTTKGFKRPVATGMFFLALYYFTVSIVSGFLYKQSLGWFTPLGAFDNNEITSTFAVIAGVVLQICASVFLLQAIRQHLSPPAPPAPATTSPTGAPSL